MRPQYILATAGTITLPASRGLATPGPTSPPASASAARPHSSAGGTSH